LGSFRKKAPGPLLPILLWRLPKATRETSAKHFSNSCGKVVNIDYAGQSVLANNITVSAAETMGGDVVSCTAFYIR
jgi:hypothetical protein